MCKKGSDPAIIEVINESDESASLCPEVECELGNVLDKEGREVPAQLQIVGCSQRLIHSVR